MLSKVWKLFKLRDNSISDINQIKEGSFDINELPNEILVLVFLNIPGDALCKNVILTCKRWHNLIESDSFWTRKCLNDSRATHKLIEILSENECYEPKKLYFKNPYNKNLIRNPCAEFGYDYWHPRSFIHMKYSQDMASRGEYFDLYNDLYIKNRCIDSLKEQTSWGFKIEPDDYLQKPAFDSNNNPVRNYATTYYMCTKYQLIDLYREGVDKKVIEKLKPKIEVTDWYAARHDCGCEYHIRINLYDENFKQLEAILYDEEIPQWSDFNWRIFKRVIENYPSDVRYILFEHNGKDIQFWEGHYGIKLTNSSVRFNLF